MTNRPTRAASWWYRPNALQDWELVLVEEKPTSGRFCRSLRMGGCAQMGFAEWSGQWSMSGTARLAPKLEVHPSQDHIVSLIR